MLVSKVRHDQMYCMRRADNNTSMIHNILCNRHQHIANHIGTSKSKLLHETRHHNISTHHHIMGNPHKHIATHNTLTTLAVRPCEAGNSAMREARRLHRTSTHQQLLCIHYTLLCDLNIQPCVRKTTSPTIRRIKIECAAWDETTRYIDVSSFIRDIHTYTAIQYNTL